MDGNGMDMKLVVGLGAGLGLVGYVVYREQETAEMAKLNQRSKDLVMGRLGGAVEGEGEGKAPSAENIVGSLVEAQGLGIPESNDVVEQSRALLKKTVEIELKQCMAKTSRAVTGEEGFGSYADGMKLKRKINLATRCQWVYHRRLPYFFKPIVKYQIDAELLKEAATTLTTVTKGKQTGERRALMTAVKYLPGYIVALGMGVVQFQLDHQIFSMLPEMVEIESEEGMSGVKRQTKNILVVVLLSRMMSVVSGTLLSKVTSGFSLELHSELVKSCLKQDMSFFDKQPPGLSKSLQSDVEQLRSCIFDSVFNLVKSGAKLFTCIRTIHNISPRLFIPCVVPLPIALGMLGVTVCLMSSEPPARYTVSLLEEIRTVREHVMEWEEGRNQTVMAKDEARVEMKGQFVSDCMMNTVIGLVTLQVVGVHAYGCELLDGVQKRTVMQAVSISALTLMEAVPSFIDSGFQASSLRAPLRRVGHILDLSPSVEPEYETITPAAEQQLKGEIEVLDVSFEYPAAEEGAKQALNRISFKAAPGQNVAIVGPIGCGKSTIMKLLEGFYYPDKGSILIDGVPIQEHNLHTLRRSMAVVAQDSVLLGTSIKEAITYGLLPPPGDDVVKQACVDANAWDFIEELKDGLHSRMNCVGGVQLSGGQKQCVAIARALIRAPTILLLDEATSSLDTISEKRVQEGIARLRERSVKTTVTIAHRLQTVMHCDLIVVTEEGSVVETGTHATLHEIPDGHYRKLWDTQRHEDPILTARIATLEQENASLKSTLETLTEEAKQQQQQQSRKGNFALF